MKDIGAVNRGSKSNGWATELSQKLARLVNRMMSSAPSRLRVAYHSALLSEFENYTGENGWTAERLKDVTERDICLRHESAAVDGLLDAATATLPAIRTLDLGGPNNMRVRFTINGRHAVVIGYNWDFPDPELCEDRFCGACYYEWERLDAYRQRHMTGYVRVLEN